MNVKLYIYLITYFIIYLCRRLWLYISNKYYYMYLFQIAQITTTALAVTFHVDAVKTMTYVTKGMVPALMSVRVTGMGRGVTVSMKYCTNANCNETDRAF